MEWGDSGRGARDPECLEYWSPGVPRDVVSLSSQVSQVERCNKDPIPSWALTHVHPSSCPSAPTTNSASR